MTVRTDPMSSDESGAPAAPCPHPVSLETIAAMEQAFGEMLASLRRKASRQQDEEAGAAEYASWLQQLQ